MHLRSVVTLLSVVAAYAVNVAAALATEFLYEATPKSKLVPVGTNFVADQNGTVKLTATGITVSCERSSLGSTLTANKSAVPIEAPKAEVQSAVFGRCKELTGTKSPVVVRTKTNPAWKLEWTAGKTLTLTAVSSTIELQGLGVTCTLKNKGGSNLNLTWENGELATFNIAEQLLTVEGGGGCPTEAKVNGQYRLSTGYVGDVSENMFLE